MLKKTFKFSLVVLAMSALILCMTGLIKINHRNNKTKEPKKKETIEKFKEIKILAVKEKVLPPKPKKKPEKKFSKKKRSKTKKPAANRKARSNQMSQKKMISKRKYQENVSQKSSNSGHLASAQFNINRQLIETGKQLINKKVSVPIVLASYDQIGFEAYLNKMNELGGRLYLGDADKQKIIAEVNLFKGQGKYVFSGFDNGNLKKLESLALFRPREITGEPMINQIIASARQFFDNYDLRCVILLPLETEAAFLGALKQYLAGSGYHISQFDVFWGTYIKNGSLFGLKVKRGRLRWSQKLIDLEMVLSM